MLLLVIFAVWITTAMHLLQISLQNFKNYREEQFSFPGKITSLVGNNGAGKTNVLDAIHYLSFCKSYFNAIDQYSIHHHAEGFSITGRFRLSEEGSSDQVHCTVRKGLRKVFKVNGKELDRLADHIGTIPAVMISPYDNLLIDGGSETRRRYIDMVISQFDRVYLDDLISYNRALLQRNTLLKQMGFEIRFDPALLSVWDEQIITHGQRIFAARHAFIAAFVPVFRELYQHLSGDAEPAGIEYSSHLDGITSPEFLLTESLEKDRQARYTTTGVHKDDLQLTLSGMPVKRFGSQGQQKSFIVALKLAQFVYLTRQLKIKPLLLLDDIFDKLDRTRVERMMDLVSNDQFGQIFITDTNVQRIEAIFSAISADTDVIEINNGFATHQKISKYAG
jgi:DNA replication and repair protein RecF